MTYFKFFWCKYSIKLEKMQLAHLQHFTKSVNGRAQPEESPKKANGTLRLKTASE